MSEAQLVSFSTISSNGDLQGSNEQVWACLREMHAAGIYEADYKDVIAHITADFVGSAAEGNARAAPIIRALSEGHDLGVLQGRKVGKRTLYRWVGESGVPREKNPTYKQRYESLLETVSEKDERIETLLLMNSKLREENQGLRARAA